MLGAAQTNAFGPEGHSAPGITWVVGIRPDAEPAERVGPGEQLLQVDLFSKIGVHRLDDPCKHLARGTVDRDIVSLVDHDIGANDTEEAFLVIDANTFSACDTGQAKAACDYRRVAGCATAGG